MKNKKWILTVCAFVIVMIVCLLGWYTQTFTNQEEDQPNNTPITNDTDMAESAQATDSDAESISPMHTVQITRPDIMIYTGPGYDYSDTGTLLEKGTCTITDVETDREGISWGLLASGSGWIDLKKAETEAPHIPITMELDCDGKLMGREYHEHIVTDSEYTQRLLFRAHETLSDVRFTMMDITADGIISGDPLYTLDTLSEEKPLVIGVVFFGDLTTFGLSFTDVSGTEHYYMLYTSGRNGSVVMQAYTPKEN